VTGGELIRNARKRVGWTQAELAERVGLQREDVSKIETGYIGLGEDRAAMFAGVAELGVTVEELLPPQAEGVALANLRREIASLRARVKSLEATLRVSDGSVPRGQATSKSRGG
jgi:transcriptional regulator with XRE-family HTH domain